jgi:two-component system, NarL family, response regulator LiaR
MSNQSIRVLIVDDHTMVRKGMKAFLGEYADICVIGEAASGAEAVRLFDQLNPDVILIDLMMPGIDGIEAIRRITAIRPEQRIIVLTADGKEDKILQAVKAGAMGYMLKNADPEELVHAIRRVHSGAPAFNNMILWRILSQKGGAEPHKSTGNLSKRETEVLRLLAKGYSDQEIASQLWLTEVTIRTHVSRILAKLGLKNRVQAALYSLRSGLVTLDAAGDQNQPSY